MSADNARNTKARLTDEERAEIRRRNGAKSKGPITQMGKDISRMNSLKHGRHVSHKELIVPPHTSVLFTEDRTDFIRLYNQMKTHYRPTNPTELDIVRDIADTRWKLNRAKVTETAIENRALYNQAVDPSAKNDDIVCEVENFIIAMESIAKNPALLEARRQIRHLTRLVGTLNKQLADLRKHFPNTGHNLINNDDEIESEFLVSPALLEEPCTEDADTEDAEPEDTETEPIEQDAPVDSAGAVTANQGGNETIAVDAPAAVHADPLPATHQTPPPDIFGCTGNEPGEVVENTRH